MDTLSLFSKFVANLKFIFEVFQTKLLLQLRENFNWNFRSLETGAAIFEMSRSSDFSFDAFLQQLKNLTQGILI